MNDAVPVLRLDAIVRTYRAPGAPALEVLRGASLDIARGELVALVAPSGAGKSTLLHVAGLLEWPDGGDVVIGGRSCGAMSDDGRTAVRRRDVGFVYQFHHLLPEFSALENVAMPRMIAGAPLREARDAAMALLDSVGLKDRAAHRPARLSGGEQQRVAIVRALANEPRLLLADEPTGNLDVRTADAVFDMMLELVRGTGLSALVATHNPELARRMDRAVTIADGTIVDKPL
ncbi:MAG: ABC transporter ATP-binding protein [Rhodospirillales bacterium]|nr:MAG: ABC transporter ATP-binding protein [Rhodospirillales bacterium]